MKCTSIALPIILSSASSISAENEQHSVQMNFPANDSSAGRQSYLRSVDVDAITTHNVDQDEFEGIGERHLAFATRAEGWINAHNSRREKYQLEYGADSFTPIEWNVSLRQTAKALADEMASDNCNLKQPTGLKYGVNLSSRFGYPNLPMTEWVVAQWETRLDLGYPQNGAITQVLWSKSRYVGCADAFSRDQSGEMTCSVSVCLYSKVSSM